VKPRMFDGMTSVDEYLMHFEEVSECNQWSTQQMRRQLILSSSDGVREVLSSTKDLGLYDYRELVDRLKYWFADSEYAFSHRSVLPPNEKVDTRLAEKRNQETVKQAKQLMATSKTRNLKKEVVGTVLKTQKSSRLSIRKQSHPEEDVMAQLRFGNDDSRNQRTRRIATASDDDVQVLRQFSVKSQPTRLKPKQINKVIVESEDETKAALQSSSDTESSADEASARKPMKKAKVVSSRKREEKVIRDNDRETESESDAEILRVSRRPKKHPEPRVSEKEKQQKASTSQRVQKE
jgi:hypothetical protein